MKAYKQSLFNRIWLFSVLFLLGLHLYFFTVLGMLLFPRDHGNATDARNHSEIESKVGKVYMSVQILLTCCAQVHGNLFAMISVSCPHHQC
jgi:hypothetical protein